MKQTGGQFVWTIEGDLSMGFPCAAQRHRQRRRQGAGAGVPELAGVSDVHDGCSQAKARLEVMDEIGIWAQIVYPNVLGFGGQGPSAKVDPSCA